jgi:hypothetical protein
MKNCLLFILALTGCATISSSLHFTKGTQYLDQCNYPAAVVELEQAVALDPDMARNHNNLCNAYVGVEDWDQAWISARKAVLAKYEDAVGDRMFRQLCRIMIINQGLAEPGTSVDELKEKLGCPDIETWRSLQYGTFIFYIEDGKVAGSRMLHSSLIDIIPIKPF